MSTWTKLASANIAPTDTESISLDLIKRGVNYSGKEANTNRSSDL